MTAITTARSRRMLLVTLVLLYGLCALLALMGKVRVDVSSTFWLFVTIGTFVPMHAYAHLRGMTPVQSLLDTVIAGLLATPPIVFLTYVAIGFAMPLADARLMELDAVLGFDWLAFVQFVDDRPLLALFLGFAYSSFAYQLLALPAVLSLLGHAPRAYAFIFAYIVVNLVACVISVWYPALGAYEYLGVDPTTLRSIDAKFGFFFLQEFHGVRSQTNFVLDYTTSAGILTFPSVHAAVAGLCAWAAWSVRPLRYPVLALNVGMAVSALSHGSHYLVDVIAGLGLAGLAISVALTMFYRPGPGNSSLVLQHLHRWSQRAC